MKYKEKEIEKYIEGFTSDPEIINGITARIMYEIRNTAQEAYLQCLAVHCGESECSEAIKSKFNL